MGILVSGQSGEREHTETHTNKIRIVAIVVGFCFVTMFFFVPETFWDRMPRPQKKTQSRKNAFTSLSELFNYHNNRQGEKSASLSGVGDRLDARKLSIGNTTSTAGEVPPTIAERRLQRKKHHVGFSDVDESMENPPSVQNVQTANLEKYGNNAKPLENPIGPEKGDIVKSTLHETQATYALPVMESSTDEKASDSRTLQPASATFSDGGKAKTDYLDHDNEERNISTDTSKTVRSEPVTPAPSTTAPSTSAPITSHYTSHLRTQPPKTFRQTLKPWNGVLRHDNWFKVALRPFILFAYPAILWSTLVYSLSIGWLIVLSESVSEIYRNKETYNFSALQTGLVYISPFIGGILGTAVAGKVSDLIVRLMSRRNGGIYEPEFRLVMAIPVLISTCIGLMGFGWSAEEKDNWIIPTIFFGIISFGCSLGSTTSITFAVDSYRQYAGEALVTLNFSKNVFHGLVFSLFFNRWLEDEGSKRVFLAVGGIQIVCLCTTVPMFVWGKRARMWTVRRNLMEKF